MSAVNNAVTQIAIVGAGGRMGRMLTETILNTASTQLVAAIDARGSRIIDKDAGLLAGFEAIGIKITDDMHAIDGADAIIDFTVPTATAALAPIAVKYGVAHIIGTTGLNQAQAAAIHSVSNIIPVVWAPNFSAGITLLRHLTRLVSSTLDDAFDIEVVEMHHKHKIDAPSGTALGLGEAAAVGRNVSLDTHGVFERHGQIGERDKGTIGFATIRGGDVIGDHTVMFAGPSERIELTHKAQNRKVFASGAVRAATWAKTQAAGLYDMTDVLGISL